MNVFIKQSISDYNMFQDETVSILFLTNFPGDYIYSIICKHDAQ